jgi:hypothetical protein
LLIARSSAIIQWQVTILQQHLPYLSDVPVRSRHKNGDHTCGRLEHFPAVRETVHTTEKCWISVGLRSNPAFKPASEVCCLVFTVKWLLDSLRMVRVHWNMSGNDVMSVCIKLSVFVRWINAF